MKARFRVTGRLDRGGFHTDGTVVIDRDAGTFSVRPLRSRRAYTLPLSTVADLVVQRLLRVEVEEEARHLRRAVGLRPPARRRRGLLR